MQRKQPKYLMLDHGGVLDGEVILNVSKNITWNDLVLEKYDWGYQILKNGVAIVKHLNQLVDNHGYQIVFHSKNNEEDQLRILKQLQDVCKTKGLSFPKVTAMVIYNNKSMQNAAEDPLLGKTACGIITFSYGQELDGKTCVRHALENGLNISPADRKNHIVFDDGENIIKTAKTEGYKAYLINNEQSLDNAISEVVEINKNPSLAKFSLLTRARMQLTMQEEDFTLPPAKNSQW